MTRDEFEKKYFEERIRPAVDNGADLRCNVGRKRLPFEKAHGDHLIKTIDVILFRNDGKSIGMPTELKSFVQDLTPDVWEAIAIKDGSGLYKGWSWTFFPAMRDRLDAAAD